MLKNISKIISPELLKILAEMGHSDIIILADANFPAESKGKNNTVIRCDGMGMVDVLDAILELMPLDHYVEKPIKLIEVDKGQNVETPIWEEFYKVAEKHEGKGSDLFEPIDRFDFYKMSTQAYAIVATGETALYGCLALQKGVLKE